MNDPDPKHPIGRVREMSGNLEPEKVTLREFGKAVADALEYLATVINNSHADLRGDIKKLVDAQTELVTSQNELGGKIGALIQRMDRANGPRLSHQELRLMKWKTNVADLNRLRGLDDDQREEFRARIDELEREQERLGSEIVEYERNLKKTMAEEWAEADERRLDKLGDTLDKISAEESRMDKAIATFDKRNAEREAARKEEGQNG